MESYIQAETLYILRERTGFISGTDLHEVFRDLCKGEPSPLGSYKIPIQEFRNHKVATWVLHEVANKSKYQDHLAEMGFDNSPEKSNWLFYLCRDATGLQEVWEMSKEEFYEFLIGQTVEIEIAREITELRGK